MTVNIIKIGGKVIDDTENLNHFLQKFTALEGKKVLVHGGGKIATKIAEKLGVETQMVEGRRITDAAMRDVVTMVYGGLINKQIVASLQSLGCNAIGLTGTDGAVVTASKRPANPIDYGFVGDIKKVNTRFLSVLLENDLTPVFAPLTYETSGQILNTNADTLASEIAVAISGFAQVNLIYCFEKEGVLDPDDKVIPNITSKLYAKLKEEKVVFDGMIPKLDNAFSAITSGVQNVIICNANAINEAANFAAGTRINN